MTNSNITKMPEFKVNAQRNGYEIRTDILELAKDAVLAEYNFKIRNWEITASKDKDSGQYVTTIGMPEVPGLAEILKAAEAMYSFVNVGIDRKQS